ncbi:MULTISPECIES: RNA-binding cell elongation regulator Jag/EloR [unclassified Fusibacter]|uniref:RNA-binding cell elongation regulator Jag/EloR n=1 Tax=unclassified Fusibacter TaxID=2624464 RepID=UPI0010120398|nr:MULTISPECIES: RNA-binding cell elongation regulator Jag/EloR [unclassified Fusibacter]MCK8060852.1 protein jag [Fusibacter sp. A2]NPE23148.1 protein jag [Fusibacter sp. A1]RXV59506.1 protein jag [Fusibacter sp. A1]
MRSYEVVAKTVDDAIEQALAALNTTIDEVEIEIFEETQKGLLGFLKAKEVRVVASLKETVIDKAVSFLKDMLAGMGVDATFDITETPENLNIDIKGDDMAIVIGRRGQTLDALQYLVSLVVNKGRENYLRVVLDTENYRSKREASLIKLANKLAYKAKKYKKEIVLEPMNPYERRIIHASLQSNKFVSTRSEGEEPNRKVVIFLNK